MPVVFETEDVRMRRVRGHTLVEVMMAVAIFVIIALPTAVFFVKSVKGVSHINVRAYAQPMVLNAYHAIEFEVRLAVLVTSASANGRFMEFRQDHTRNPNLASAGHICNPPDCDFDAATVSLLPPAQRWRAGFNVFDDDCDNDMQVDVLCRIWQNGDEIFLAHNFNNTGWQTSTLLKNVPPGGLRFQFFGSPSEPSGSGLDANNDGQISFNELDTNGNGELDAQERLAITTVGVWVAMDTSRTSGTIVNSADLGKTQFWMRGRIAPILLPIRARP